METLWRIAAFILNNLVTLGVIFSTLIVFSFLMRRLIREKQLNRKLFKLQSIMRQSRNQVKWYRLIRQGTLALAPIFLLSVYMITLMPSRITYTSHLKPVSDGADLTSIYQAYHHKNRTSTLDIMPTERSADAPMMQESTGGDVEVAAVNTPKHTLHVANENERLYVLNNQTLQVIDLQEDNRRMIMQWPLPLTTSEMPLDPEHLFATESHLVVIGTVGNGSILVLVYDRADHYNLIHRTILHGELNQAVSKTGHLHILLTTSLPNPSELFSIDDYLPKFTHNNHTNHIAYTDIHYVEDTKPSGFIVHYHFDLSAGTLHPEALFTDVEAIRQSTYDAFYLAIPSKRFSESTEVFVVSNPIIEHRTALVRIPLRPTLNLDKETQMISGYPVALDIYEEQLALLTRPAPLAEGGRLNLFTHQLNRLSSHVLTDDFAAVYRFTENACTYVHAEQDASLQHAIHWQNGALELEEVPHSHTLGPTTSIEIDTGMALLVSIVSGENRRNPDGLALSLHQYAASCHDTKVGEYVARFSDFGILSTPIISASNTLMYDDINGFITVPFDTYETWPVPRNMPGLLLFEAKADTFNFLQVIRHEHETASSSTYRALNHETWLITVSRNYVQIWDKEDALSLEAVIPLP